MKNYNCMSKLDELLEEEVSKGNIIAVLDFEDKGYSLKHNNYLLFCAVYSNNVTLVKYLISKGCKNTHTYCVIDECILTNNFKMLKVLAESGIEITLKNWEFAEKLGRGYADWVWEQAPIPKNRVVAEDDDTNMLHLCGRKGEL